MSDIINFVKNDSYHNVAVKKSAIIGFDRMEDTYKVYLKGGGCIDVRAGQWEYEQLIKAMEGDNNNV